MKDDVEKEIDKKNKKVKLEITGRNAYIGFSPGQSFRTLKPSDNIFSKPLEQKANEKPIFSMRYSLGMQVVIFKHLMLDFGFTYTEQGEQYAFKSGISDSSYSYTNKYRYIGVPITVNGIFGGDVFKFYFGAGIAPMMFINQLEKINYVTEDGAVREEKTNIRDTRYNQFNLMAIGKFGMQLKFTEYVGFYVAPEFRYNLLNTFESQYKFVHHQMAWSIDVGIIVFM